MNRFLFPAADFLSRPPGFYVLVIAMVLCTLLEPFRLTNAMHFRLPLSSSLVWC